MNFTASLRSKSFLTVLFVVLAFLFLAASCDLNGLLKQGSTKKTAILYGIAQYDPALNPGVGINLTYPPADVASMQSLLVSQGWTVISRIDSAASGTQLALDIQTVTNGMEAGERVLFYYSGHGVDQTGELVPYQTPSGGVADASQFISPAKLSSMFQPIVGGGGNLIMILDSCYSGKFVSTGSYTSNLPDVYGDSTPGAFTQSISDYFNNASQTGPNDKPNVWVLSAAGFENSYDDVETQHGAFTTALLDGLNMKNGHYSADYNGDGYVTLSELNRHTTEWLNANWNTSDYPYSDSNFLPHLSGNPLDILLFKQ